MIYPSAAAALHQQTPGAGQCCISATVRLQRIPGVGEAASWRIPGTEERLHLHSAASWGRSPRQVDV